MKLNQYWTFLQFLTQLPDVTVTVQPGPQHVAWRPTVSEYAGEHRI